MMKDTLETEAGSKGTGTLTISRCPDRHAGGTSDLISRIHFTTVPTSTITWHCFRRSTHITSSFAAYEQAQADAGLAPSDDTIDRILKSCKSYLIRPENSLLTETFASRLNAVEGLSNAEKASYKAKTSDHFKGTLYPGIYKPL